MNEAKDDSQFKKDIAEAIQQSNETFAQSMQQMSLSMLQVAQGFTRSFEFLARTMINNHGQPPYQYHSYRPNDVLIKKVCMVQMAEYIPQATLSLTHHSKSKPTHMRAANLGWITMARGISIPCRERLLY